MCLMKCGSLRQNDVMHLAGYAKMISHLKEKY